MNNIAIAKEQIELVRKKFDELNKKRCECINREINDLEVATPLKIRLINRKYSQRSQMKGSHFSKKEVAKQLLGL